MVLPVRLLVMEGPPWSVVGEVASWFACNRASAAARSSGCTILFGASSSFISQPMGGEGGGEMKNSRSDFGRARCWSEGFMGVFTPK